MNQSNIMIVVAVCIAAIVIGGIAYLFYYRSSSPIDVCTDFYSKTLIIFTFLNAGHGACDQLLRHYLDDLHMKILKTEHDGEIFYLAPSN